MVAGYIYSTQSSQVRQTRLEVGSHKKRSVLCSILFINPTILQYLCHSRFTVLSFFFSKLHDLVPEEEMDLLTTEETWKPLRDLDQLSEDASSVNVDADTTGKR